MNYARALSFTATPDYVFLRSLFRGLFLKLGYAYDFQWDWKLLQYEYFNFRPAEPLSLPKVSSPAPIKPVMRANAPSTSRSEKEQPQGSNQPRRTPKNQTQNSNSSGGQGRSGTKNHAREDGDQRDRNQRPYGEKKSMRCLIEVNVI